MPRNITVTFDDGTSHVYQNAPDNITPADVQARAQKDFGKSVTALDGGNRASQSAPDVPKWGQENPNLYGLYGAGRALLKTGIEAGAQALGAGLGAASPVPGGSLIGSGVGYAGGKKAANALVSAMDTAVGNPTEQDTSSNTGNFLSGAAMQGAGNLLAKGIAAAVPKSVVNKLYSSALKLPTTMPQAERSAAIATGLNEGAVPTESVGSLGKWLGMKGHEQIVGKINELDDAVSNIISNAAQSGDTVSSKQVANGLQSLIDKGKRISKADPTFLDAIQKVRDEFLAGPDSIPVNVAQEMKRHIYKVYQDYYGAPDAIGAYIQGKKAIASGIKQALEEKFPQIGALNMEEGRLLNFLDPFNRAVGRIANRDVVGLGLQVAPMTGEALSGGTGAARMAAAAKILDLPSVKARIAVLLNNAQQTAPNALRQAAGRALPTATIGTSNYLDDQNNSLAQ